MVSVERIVHAQHSLFPASMLHISIQNDRHQALPIVGRKEDEMLFARSAKYHNVYITIKYKQN